MIKNNINLKEKIELFIVLNCSLLLGIWATKETIALRNVLLVLLLIVSIIYIEKIIKKEKIIIINYRKFNFFYYLPIIIIIIFYVWITIHYLYFSNFVEQQFQELKSTWLRALIASIIGFICALSIQRNQLNACLLFSGLLLSFLYLFFQYLPKTLETKSIFAIDWYGNYIYFAKHNGVLAGIILLSSILGLMLDYGYNLYFSEKNNTNKYTILENFFLLGFFILGFILPIYAFVFIFSAKNGVGLSAILTILWVIISGYVFSKKIQKRNFRILTVKLLVIYITILTLFILLFYQHNKFNSGWINIIEDIQISSKVDTFTQWKDPTKYGLPLRADGTTVSGNIYERVAWAIIGARLIIHNPCGSGILKSFPVQLNQEGIDFNSGAYTHSAWIDLGLSYGLPGILLIPITLILCILTCITKYKGKYKYTIIFLSIAILLLYTLGEYAFDHGIEILMFIASLVISLSRIGYKNYR